MRRVRPAGLAVLALERRARRPDVERPCRCLDGFREREGRDAVGEGSDREEESGVVVHRACVER